MGKLDISGVFDWISSTFPNQKKIIFAHSLGGQLVGFIDRHKEIDAVFMVASGTGYWKDVTAHRKWYFALLWYVLVPMHTMLFGFANLNKVGQGANLPKGIALQLRRWCTSYEYFEPELDKELSPVYFDKIRTPFYTLQFDDDPLTNRITAKKLLDFYTNAEIKTRIVKPEEFGVDKIGHAGFFSRKFKDTLWSDTLQKIEGTV